MNGDEGGKKKKAKHGYLKPIELSSVEGNRTCQKGGRNNKKTTCFYLYFYDHQKV
jgi:hypothetical protein